MVQLSRIPINEPIVEQTIYSFAAKKHVIELGIIIINYVVASVGETV